jgi:exodeoxyribonuclease-3
MKIISWNVNGIRAVHKKGLLEDFINKHKPDILCLQEIKAKKEDFGIDFKDYQEFWNPAERAGYSGTAIFTKTKPESITLGFPTDISTKYDLQNDTYGDLNKEGRVITAEFDSPAGEFYLVNVYTPNSKGDLSRLPLRHKKWDPAFLEYADNLKKTKNVIFCGDLNVAHKPQDLANPRANEGEHGFTEEERFGVDNMIKSGFIDTFRHFTPEGNGYYTWWSHFAKSRERNVGWRIDYFFANRDMLAQVKSATILPEVQGSDHCPVLLELK